MENATKALLIAAAVLITILVISLGIVIYNKASESVGNLNFDEQEIKAFNDKFTHYEATHVRGSDINAMLNTVLDSNMNTTSEGSKAPAGGKASVKNGDKTSTADAKYVEVTGDVTLLSNATRIPKKAETSKLYKVEVDRNPVTGFVNVINVKLVNS